MLRMIRNSLGTLAVLVLIACADSLVDVPVRQVVSVDVSPASQTLAVGDSLIVTASPKAADGTILNDVPVAWASGNETIAALTPNGLTTVARALTPGQTRITAVAGGRTGNITLTVVAAPLVVATVTITPALGALEVGRQFELRPVLRAQDGTVIGGRTVAWQTSDPTIATLAGAPDGSAVTLSALRAGDVVITAAADGRSAQRTIRILPASPVRTVQVIPDSLMVETGREFELNAVLWGADGQPVSWPVVQWYSSDGALLEVKSVNGQRAVISALRAGTATITADVNGVTGRAVIRVKDAASVSSVVITGGTFAGHTLWTGQLAQLRAYVYGAAGAEMSNHPVAWSVQDTTIATMRADGVVQGLKPGTTHVIAKAGTKSATALLSVYPYPSDGLLLELRPSEDPHGYPRVAVVVGTTTWTDTDGTTYPAQKTLVGGTLNIGRGISGYEQRLEIETTVVKGSNRLVVARDTILDRGTVVHDMLQALRNIWLTSTMTGAGQVRTYFLQPGRLVVPQQIGSAPPIEYLYVVK